MIASVNVRKIILNALNKLLNFKSDNQKQIISSIGENMSKQ